MTETPPAAALAELHAAAAQLCGRYAHALDEHRWSDLAEVFAPEAEMEFAHVGPVAGPRAIGRTCAEALGSLDASQHLIGSIVVTADGEQPTSRCYFQAQHVKDGKQFMVAGTYTDTLRRAGNDWRIARRVQEITWTQGDGSVVGL